MAGVRELRDLGGDDLVQRLDASKEELFNLRFQLATGQLDNPMRIKEVRRDVARILTILRERELEADEPVDRGAAPEETPDGEPGARASGLRRRRLRKEQEAS